MKQISLSQDLIIPTPNDHVDSVELVIDIRFPCVKHVYKHPCGGPGYAFAVTTRE